MKEKRRVRGEYSWVLKRKVGWCGENVRRFS